MTTKAKKTTKTAKAKKESAKPTVTRSTEKGYKGHNAGSRKEEVHKAYDAKGIEAAVALGEKLKLKPGTVKSWIGAWRRADEAAKSKKAA